MCKPAPVAQRAWQDDQARYGGRVRFLGIVGDQAHSRRKSDHNCGNPGYAPGYAHALDTGVDTAALGYEIVKARLRDPRVKYVIFKARLYYPDGTVRSSSGHPDHVHTSFRQGTTHDTRPFYGTATPNPKEWDEMATREEIKQAVREVLNEGTVKGQTNWAGTNKAMASTVQEIVNDTRRIPDPKP